MALPPAADLTSEQKDILRTWLVAGTFTPVVPVCWRSKSVLTLVIASRTYVPKILRARDRWRLAWQSAHRYEPWWICEQEVGCTLANRHHRVDAGEAGSKASAKELRERRSLFRRQRWVQTSGQIQDAAGKTHLQGHCGLFGSSEYRCTLASLRRDWWHLRVARRLCERRRCTVSSNFVNDPKTTAPLLWQ